MIGISLEFGLLTFLRDGKWGLVDTAGQVIVAPQFEDPVSFLVGPARHRLGETRGPLVRDIDPRGQSVPGLACTDDQPVHFLNNRFVCTVEP